MPTGDRPNSVQPKPGAINPTPPELMQKLIELGHAAGNAMETDEPPLTMPSAALLASLRSSSRK